MISSMTGYGTNTFSGENFTLETEVKSLNSRYLDLSIKLPKELSKYEFDIRDLVKKYIIRGKVILVTNLIYDQDVKTELVFNKNSLDKVMKNLEEMKSIEKIEENITLDHILSLKDYFIADIDSSIEIEWDILKESILNSLKLLVKMREDEGDFLKADINSRLDEISKYVSEIQEISKHSTQDYFKKFKEKAQKLTEEFVDDHERFIMELGILSEKHDVTEECIRLKSHLKIFNDAITKSKDVGRRLNFICQEMNREVNTINSKSISSEISHLGINIKEELEKIREQVQNIE